MTRTEAGTGSVTKAVTEAVTDAVLFDMDGLLIDSEPLWLEAETAVMARLGADWTPADQAQLLGGSLVRTVRYLLGKATRAWPPCRAGNAPCGPGCRRAVAPGPPPSSPPRAWP